MITFKTYAGELAEKLESYSGLGREQASRNLPSSDSARPDSNESQLKVAAEKCLASEQMLFDSALMDASRSIAEIQHKTTELQTSAEQLQSESSISSVAETEMAGERAVLVRATEARLSAEAEYRFYCATNRISEKAIYPESWVYHIAIIGAVALLESVINAVFYENAQGLLGGFVVALGVGALNMSLAGVLGFFFRYKNLPAIEKKLFGWTCLVGYVFSSVLLNALFAAFRSEYQVLGDPTDYGQLRMAFTGATQAAVRVFIGEMPVKDLMSLLLFAFGFGLSLVAFCKGYTLDDRFPGHGVKDRQLRAAQTQEEELQNELRQRIRTIGQRREAAVQTLLHEPSARINLVAKRVSELRQTQAQTENRTAAIARDFQLVLDAYRHSNISVRATPPPEYYKEPLSLSGLPDTTAAMTLLDQLEGCGKALKLLQGEQQPILTALLEKVRSEIRTMLDEGFEQFRAKVKQDAQNSINERQQTMERVR